MTQEDKELLLKDLCARLPYNVKCCAENNPKISGDLVGIIGENVYLFSSGYGIFNIDVIKPYLFPLSSMTDEQEKEFNSLNWFELDIFPHTEKALDYVIKNHFDYRFLIDEGLAIDATGLNIY